jgi:hypothetical protein
LRSIFARDWRANFCALADPFEPFRRLAVFVAILPPPV